MLKLSAGKGGQGHKLMYTYVQVMDAKLLPATALVHVCEVCALESYSLSDFLFLFDIIVITWELITLKAQNKDI